MWRCIESFVELCLAKYFWKFASRVSSSACMFGRDESFPWTNQNPSICSSGKKLDFKIFRAILKNSSKIFCWNFRKEKFLLSVIVQKWIFLVMKIQQRLCYSSFHRHTCHSFHFGHIRLLFHKLDSLFCPLKYFFIICKYLKCQKSQNFQSFRICF